MNTISERVVSAYEVLADGDVTQALEGAFREHYERPTMMALLVDVAGKRVLDAGCGSGGHTKWFVDHGATVIAIDSSPKMVKLARSRIGDTGQVINADLNLPLDCIAPECVDIVHAALVLDYIRDWDRLFTEFNRVLVPQGRLVFSVHHPCFLDLKLDASKIESYFALEVVEEDWLPFGLSIPAYRRPLSAMADALWNGGFAIERIVEPEPTLACRESYPSLYARLVKRPVFICFSATKQTNL
jgi:SAM-dependent methyltransferase